MLAALAGDPEMSTCPVDVVEPQTGGLASTQAKPHQDHDDRPVPRPERRGPIAHAKQGRDLIGVHTPRQRSPRPSRLEDPGGQVPIEAAAIRVLLTVGLVLVAAEAELGGVLERLDPGVHRTDVGHRAGRNLRVTSAATIARMTPNIAATWMPSTNAVCAAVANAAPARGGSFSATCSAPAIDELAVPRARPPGSCRARRGGGSRTATPRCCRAPRCRARRRARGSRRSSPSRRRRGSRARPT